MKFSGPSRSVALTLSEQLRRPRDIDGDPPGLVVRRHLRLPRVGFAVSRVDLSSA
jgi:hypothetical protein